MKSATVRTFASTTMPRPKRHQRTTRMTVNRSYSVFHAKATASALHYCDSVHFSTVPCYSLAFLPAIPVYRNKYCFVLHISGLLLLSCFIDRSGGCFTYQKVILWYFHSIWNPFNCFVFLHNRCYFAAVESKRTDLGIWIRYWNRERRLGCH